MNESDGMAPDIEVGTDLGSDQPLSPLEALRKRRQEIAQDVVKVFDIPGYNGDLVAEYQLVDWKEMRGIATRNQKSGAAIDVKEMNAQIDALIKSCKRVCLRDSKGDLIPVDGDEFFAYDLRLAAALGLDAQNARQVVRGVFVHEMRIVAHHGEVVSWMQGENATVDEEYLGE